MLMRNPEVVEQDAKVLDEPTVAPGSKEYLVGHVVLAFVFVLAVLWRLFT